MRFHLAHIVPYPEMHGLHGYAEVIDTVRWGLTELGHDVSVELNRFRSDRTNIVFGDQVLAEDAINALPPDTIIYNLEQLANVAPQSLRPASVIAAKRLQIWDYNDQNIAWWKQFTPPERPPLRVEISFAPILRRITSVDEDIDVLFYGIPSPERMTVIGALCQTGLRVVYVCGLYGPARDGLIARARLVLNLNIYKVSRVFEVVRVSFLLANGKAVVSDIAPDTIIEPDLRDAAAFASPEQIPAVCERLIANGSERLALATRGQAIFEKRDICNALRRVLTAMRIS